MEVLHQKSRIHSDAVTNGVWEGSGRVGRCTITEEHSSRKRVGFLWDACVILSLECRKTELMRCNKFPLGIIKLVRLQAVQSLYDLWTDSTSPWDTRVGVLNWGCSSCLPVHKVALSTTFLTWSAHFSLQVFSDLPQQLRHSVLALQGCNGHSYDQHQALPASFQADSICWANQHLLSSKTYWVKPNSNWVQKERM